MKLDSFNFELFKQFETSSKIDGNYTGIYQGKVIRVIEENVGDYKGLLLHLDDVPFLINADLIFEDKTKIILEHHRIENITYFDEWTRKQRVEAALAVIQIQEHLIKLGYYLNDPHGFNITFENNKPIYFDFGSILKGRMNPAKWYLRCFTSLTQNDYWDDILKIGIVKKIFTAFILFFHNSPYNYLKNVIKKSEHNKFNKLLSVGMNKSNFLSKAIRRIDKVTPGILGEITNWTDYDQKDPSLLEENERTENIISIFNKYKPASIIDIGANRGAYSFLALKNGAKKAICMDLDSFSLDVLRENMNNNEGNITTARINIMNYNETPGCFNSYLPAHKRLNSDFGLCLAVVHHVCYFGNKSFDEFAERLNRFVNKTLLVEFVPYDDIHLTGPEYKGKDRSWYTQENFIKALQKYFPGDYEIYNSSPEPRILLVFNR
jgi:SAM-dependent methyltransferase